MARPPTRQSTRPYSRCAVCGVPRPPLAAAPPAPGPSLTAPRRSSTPCSRAPVGQSGRASHRSGGGTPR
eukprot:7213724-Lingulodinium_polyedra.AAC.1